MMDFFRRRDEIKSPDRGRLHLEMEKTLSRVFPLLFLTLGPETRLGGCSSRFGRRTKDCGEED